MASFQAKIGWKRLKKRENKNYRFISFLPDGQQKIPKKQQKYSKNSNIPLRLHFRTKQHGKRLKKRENKNYRFVSFLHDGQQKIPKKQQKYSKNSKIPLWLHFKQKQVGKGREIEKIKNVVPFRSHTTRNRKFQKNSKNIQKIQTYRYGFISGQNSMEKG